MHSLAAQRRNISYMLHTELEELDPMTDLLEIVPWKPHKGLRTVIDCTWLVVLAYE